VATDATADGCHHHARRAIADLRPRQEAISYAA
jgi:hypothetical protein